MVGKKLRSANTLPIIALAAAALLPAGCTYTIGQASFFPAGLAPPAGARFTPPADVVVTDRLVPLPGVATAKGGAGGEPAVVRMVRLDRPGSADAIIYHGGNGHFIAAESARLARLSAVTGMDVIAYDYPGRGGTTVAPTVADTLAATRAMLATLRAEGWVPPARTGGAGAGVAAGGPGARTFVYGLSFGGSQAAAMVRDGGIDGIIIEGSASDIAGIGRDFAPALVRPFLKLRLTPDMAAFDYESYLVAARAPVLVLASQEDDIIRPARMTAMAKALRARGVAVTLTPIPGGHGSALNGRGADAAGQAIQAFVGRAPTR